MVNNDSQLTGGWMSDDGRYVVFAQSGVSEQSKNSFGQPTRAADGCLNTLFVRDMSLGRLSAYALPRSVNGVCAYQQDPTISGDGQYVFVRGIAPVLWRDLVTRNVDTWFRINLSNGVIDNAPRQTGGFTLQNNGTYGYGDPIIGSPLQMVASRSGENFAFMLNVASGQRSKMWHREIKDVTVGAVELVGQQFDALHGNDITLGSGTPYFDLSPNGRKVVYTEEFQVALNLTRPTETRKAVRYMRYDTVTRRNDAPLLTEASGRAGEDFLLPNGLDAGSTGSRFAKICGMNEDGSKLMLWSNLPNPSAIGGRWSTGAVWNILIYDVASRRLTLGQNRNAPETACAQKRWLGPARNMSADGNLLVTLESGTLYVFNVAKNRTIRIPHTGFSRDFQISRDGRYILKFFDYDDNLADGSTLRTAYPYASGQYIRIGPILPGYFD